MVQPSDVEKFYDSLGVTPPSKFHRRMAIMIFSFNDKVHTPDDLHKFCAIINHMTEKELALATPKELYERGLPVLYQPEEQHELDNRKVQGRVR